MFFIITTYNFFTTDLLAAVNISHLCLYLFRCFLSYFLKLVFYFLNNAVKTCSYGNFKIKHFFQSKVFCYIPLTLSTQFTSTPLSYIGHLPICVSVLKFSYRNRSLTFTKIYTSISLCVNYFFF